MSAAYLVVVLTVVAVPGVDVLVTLRNTISGGRRAGIGTALGVGLGSSVQAVLVSLGIGAVIVRMQPLFQAVRWVGVAYLVWLGLTSLRSAWLGRYAEDTGGPPTAVGMRGFRDGLLTNLTNPKMLVFYLALLPQFVAPSAPVLTWLGHGMLLPVVGTAWLCTIAVGAHRVRAQLLRRRTRRAIDAVSGVVLVGFAGRLAREA